MEHEKGLKNNIKEFVDELNNRIKYMDKPNIESIIRLSAWINNDASKILKDRESKLTSVTLTKED